MTNTNVEIIKGKQHQDLKQKYESENEINSANANETTARKAAKSSLEPKLVITIDSGKKQLGTSSTTSSTEASSVVRTLVERGCQSNNNERVIKVSYFSINQ